MIRVYTAAERSVAIQYACEDLELSEDNLSIVKMRTKRVSLFSPHKKVEVSVKIESKLEHMIIDFIEHVLSYMNCSARAEVSGRTADKIYIHINTDRENSPIKNNRKVVDALQHLATIFSKRHSEKEPSVVLEVNHQRRRPDQNLLQLARRTAEKVLATGESQLLRPMSSYERRIIHKKVRTIRGVTTQSEGRGDTRRVRILKSNE